VEWSGVQYWSGSGDKYWSGSGVGVVHMIEDLNPAAAMHLEEMVEKKSTVGLTKTIFSCLKTKNGCSNLNLSERYFIKKAQT
jgi:hypothetical protein